MYSILILKVFEMNSIFAQQSRKFYSGYHDRHHVRACIVEVSILQEY